jgi:hypothetical protein
MVDPRAAMDPSMKRHRCPQSNLIDMEKAA